MHILIPRATLRKPYKVIHSKKKNYGYVLRIFKKEFQLTHREETRNKRNEKQRNQKVKDGRRKPQNINNYLKCE